jgi:hypothetical protein
MGKQTFKKMNKISKILGVLLLVSFMIFVTTTSASAESVDANYQQVIRLVSNKVASSATMTV